MKMTLYGFFLKQSMHSGHFNEFDLLKEKRPINVFSIDVFT